MAIDIRVLRWALIPLLLLVCVTIALWQLGAERDVPGARHAPTQTRDQASMKAPGGSSQVTAQQIVEWAAAGPTKI